MKKIYNQIKSQILIEKYTANNKIIYNQKDIYKEKPIEMKKNINRIFAILTRISSKMESHNTIHKNIIISSINAE